MALTLSLADELEQLQVVALEIEHVLVTPASAKLRLWADEAAQHAVEQSHTPQAEKLRMAVRQLLRHGKFKASGRSKPAQEYLMRCALEEGSLPRINGPVDVLNTASLLGGLPISLLSIANCSRLLHVRRGDTGEGYVFNSIGQLLDVEDLIVTCDATQTPARPVGSPIKDSMAGKIASDDTELVAIIYAPRDDAGIAAAKQTLELLASSLVEFCGASLGESVQLPPF
jgi:DNA/RNA-binding domain of Phe-tRNA-synthetase-like protein